MATSPAPDAAAPPGMCPGIAVLGGGGAGGDGDGDGSGGKDGAGGDGKGGKGNGSGDGKNGGAGCGDPVCPITGRVFLDLYDFGFAGPMLLRWVRSYSSRSSNRSGELGFGWCHTYGWRILERRTGVVVYDENAKEQPFGRVPATGEGIENSLGWRLRRDGDDYRLRVDDGTEYLFGPRVGDVRRLVAVSDRHGNRTELVRGEQGELTGIIDSAGRRYRVQCDRFGRICRVDVATDPAFAGSMMVALYEYDAEGNLARFVDAEGFEFRYRYEGHLLVEHATPGGLSYHYRYDGTTSAAWCVETWGDRHGSPDPALETQPPPAPATGRDSRVFKGINHVRFEYDKKNHYAEVSDALGGVSCYFGDANGRVLKLVDAAGGVTERSYDPVTGALLAESTPTGAVRQVRRQGPLSRGWQDTSGSGGSVFLDDEGGEVSFNPETGFFVRTQTDARGDVTLVQHADGSLETYASDERGLLVRTTNRLGAFTRFEHDAMGNCVLAEHQDLGVERSEFDYLGRRVAHVDVFGRRTEWTHDRRSDIVAKRNPDGSRILIELDWYRRPVHIEDRGRVYRFAYGGIGWLYRYESPGAQITEYRYDAEGHLVSVTNPRGQVHRQRYDRAGRAIACETFEGLEHRARYDAAGRAVRVVSPAGEELREHDSQGRLVGAELSDGEVVTVERDRKRRTIAFTNGQVRAEEEFDAMGQIVRDRQGRHETRVAWRGGAVAAMVSDVGVPVVLERRVSGHVDELRAGGVSVGLNRFAADNAVVSRWGDRLALVRRWGDSGELRSFTLVRVHPDGPQTPDAIAAIAPADALQHVDYSYDPRALLESEQAASGRTVSYDLDAAGQVRERRLFQSGTLASVERVAHDVAGTPLVEGAQYDALVRPTSLNGERFEYDGAGRLARRETDRGAWTYEYSTLGDLIRVVAPDHEVKLTYDGKSRRVRKCVYRQNELVKDIHYVWSNNVVLHEHDALSGASRTYLREDERWEPFGHIDVVAGEERAAFYLPHPSGAVLTAVDDAGRPVWDAELTTLGQASPSVSTVDVTARYPNQFFDADVELVYNYYRWYDPRLGVFISPDPLLLEGTINPRDYVENPFTQMDPTGLFNPAPNQSPTQQDGQGTGGGQFPRTPSAANGQPRPGLPTGNALTDPKGTYLTTPGAYATNGSNNSMGQWVPGYANVPPGFNPQAQGGWPRPLQQQVDNAGYTHGCHSCGSTDPGPSGHFTPDHQPAVSQQKAAAKAGNPIPASSVRYYPHCSRCSKNQANQQNSLSHNPAANAATAQTNAANNSNPDFAHPKNAPPTNAAEAAAQQANQDAVSNHMFGPGYNAKGPVPPAQNAGDNRYLGGQSYNNWR